MTKNIKVAVIGAGMMGKNHMKTYKGLNGVDLVGVYDIFPEAAKAAAETFGIKAFSSMEEVAKNVDAVSVVTTSVTHADVGEFFLNKGIHCMMEKPLACTEEECQRLISAAERNNVVLLVGHIERFNPAVEQMGKLLSDTSKIRSLTAQRMSAASGRITDVDVSMDLMIHDVEVIQSLVKSPVVNIQAASVKTKESPMGKDYITALLEFENGAIAPRGNDVWAVTFRYFCSDIDRQTDKKEYTIRIKLDAPSDATIKWDERFNNPLGIRVSEYVVESGNGDPLDTGYLETDGAVQ